MEVFFYISGIAWCIGCVAQFAHTSKRLDTLGLAPPFPGVMIVVFVLMFFTWPYWYFYSKY